MSCLTTYRQEGHDRVPVIEAVESNGELADEQPRHGTPVPRFGPGDGLLVLFGEQAALAQPGEGAFNPPVERDGFEAPPLIEGIVA